MKEFVLKGRLTLERVTFRVSAKTLEGAHWRAQPMGTSTVTTLTRPKALIGAWPWLRSRRTPDAPPPAEASYLYDRWRPASPDVGRESLIKFGPKFLNPREGIILVLAG